MRAFTMGGNNVVVSSGSVGARRASRMWSYEALGRLRRLRWRRNKRLARPMPLMARTGITAPVRGEIRVSPQRRMPRMSNLIYQFKKIIADRNAPETEKAVLVNEAMGRKLTPCEIANIINCMKKGNYADIGLLESMAQQLVQSPEILEHFNPVELSMSAQSLGVMSARVSPFFPSFKPLMDLLLAKCARQETNGEERFNEQSLADVVYALGMIYKQGGRLKLDKTSGAVFQLLLQKLVNVEGGESRLAKCPPQGLCTTLYGIAQLEYKNKEILDAIASEIAKPRRLAGFRNRELSLSVYSFSTLKYRNEAVLNALCMEIVKPGRLEMLQEQQFSNMVYALGVVQFKNEEVLDALSREMSKPGRIREFKAQALSNIPYGFALLEYYNKEVLDALCGQILRVNIKRFIGQGVANIVYAFAVLKYYNREVLDMLSEEIARPGRLAQFNTQELSNIVYGMGLLEYHNPTVMDALAEEIQKPVRIVNFTKQALSNIVYGFGLMEHYHEGVLTALGQEMLEPARLKAISEQESANIVYGFGLLKSRMSSTFTATLAGPVAAGLVGSVMEDQRIKCMTMHGLSNIAWGLAKLQHLDPEVMNVLIDKLLATAADDELMDVRGVSMLLHACAILNHIHEDFFDFTCGWVDRNLEQFGIRTLANNMWALAMLGHLSPRMFEKLCDRIAELGMEECKMEHNRQVLQACLYAQNQTGFPFNEKAVSMLERAKAVCRTLENDHKASLFETDVSRTLGELGIEHKLQYEIEEVCMVADILVEGDSQIVIEVDGPTHYTSNKCDGEHRQLGDTIFRNRILHFAGLKVLCVPCHTWGNLNAEEKKEWLKEQLDTLKMS